MPTDEGIRHALMEPSKGLAERSLARPVLVLVAAFRTRLEVPEWGLQ
jgi:hypothetical protein